MQSRLQPCSLLRSVLPALLLGLWLAQPGQVRSAVPTPATLVLSPTSLVSGAVGLGTVTLSAPAAPGPVTLTLSSSNPGVAAPSPASVTIPAGSSSATFAVTALNVAATTTATLSAAAGGQTKKAAVTVFPLLSGLSVSSPAVTGGTPVTGKVTLSAPAGDDGQGGTTVLLSGGASTPGSVVVPVGSTSATFAIGTAPVPANTAVHVTAALLGATRTGTITVEAPVPTSVSVTPSLVDGGAGATGTVTLSGAAAVDTTVAVSSSSGAAAVPGSVLVPAGQASGSFPVGTNAVGANTTATLSATLGTVTKTAALVVKETAAVSLTLTCPAASLYGQSVALTTTASTPLAAGPPKNAVSLYDSSFSPFPAFTALFDGSDQVVLSTADLSVGIHPLWARYTGDSTHAPAVSPTITLTVSGPGIRIMPLGDSITQGSSTDPTVSGGYRGPLWDATIAQGWKCRYVGCILSGPHGIGGCEGYKGDRIEQIQSLAPTEIADYSPDVILLQIGTNNMGGADLSKRDTPAQALTRMGALLDTLIAAAPQTQIVVASVTPAADPDIDAVFGTFNRGLPGLVQARAGSGAAISFVDMHTLCGFGPGDLSDGFHPTASGYQKMANVWYDVLSGLPFIWQ